jgi:large subunit ribosomal protein L31
MKKDIHPTNFRDVVFHDNSSGAEFVIASTVKTTETTKHKGQEYPLFRVEISSASHPFYTGTEKVIDTAGRVDRFNKRRAASVKK